MLEIKVDAHGIGAAAWGLVVVDARGQSFLDVHFGVVAAVSGQCEEVAAGEVESQALDADAAQLTFRQGVADGQCAQAEEGAVLDVVAHGDALCHRHPRVGLGVPVQLGEGDRV